MKTKQKNSKSITDILLAMLFLFAIAAASSCGGGGGGGDGGGGNPVGGGSTPNIAVSLASLNFGDVGVGYSSSVQTITINNTGTADLSITSINIAGTDRLQFPQTNNCPVSLTAGNSCNIQVTFIPDSVGAKSATLTIASNDPDTLTVNVGISGTGVTPVPNISAPASIDIGSYYEGTSSLPQTVAISNTGTGLLSIGAITVTGTDASQFTKQNDNCSGVTMSPTANCTLQVVFSPASAGVKNASLTIPSNDPDTPTVNVALSGTGLAAPNITASPDPLNLTTCPLGNEGIVTISNAGTADLIFTSISTTGTWASSFNITGDACSGAPLSAGNSCDVTILYNYIGTGIRTANLTVISNDLDTPTLNVLLRGIYVNPASCP